jgi:hypothetical protein
MTHASMPVDRLRHLIKERFVAVEKIVVDHIAALDALSTTCLSIEDVYGKAKEIGTEVNRMHAVMARLVVLSGFVEHAGDWGACTMNVSFEEAAALGFTDAMADQHWREEIVPAVDAAVDRVNTHIARLQERGEARESPLFPNHGRNPLLS